MEKIATTERRETERGSARDNVGEQSDRDCNGERTVKELTIRIEAKHKFRAGGLGGEVTSREKAEVGEQF